MSVRDSPSLAASPNPQLQVCDDGRQFPARRFPVWKRQQRHLAHVAPARRQDVPGLQMLKQRIELGVLRNDVKVRARVLPRQLSDVERDMEILRVRPAPCDFDVRRALAYALQAGGGLERDLGLCRADKHDQAGVILMQNESALAGRSYASGQVTLPPSGRACSGDALRLSASSGAAAGLQFGRPVESAAARSHP